ncbi:MAG: hydroxymethylglutaryl-CoA lyase [Pseudomonadales bacterium]|nr:hydroxymethylglutaryl-CoA lyase [Pseudomonadales bacterium]
MSELPKFVEFHEEGPREGFQSEKKLFSLEERVGLIDALSDTGLKQIQVASFVSPKAVPAMADAADLFGAIKRTEGVRYTGLWLNENGFERAAAAPKVDLDGVFCLYTSEPFCKSNNNCSIEDMRQKQIGWLDAYARHGVSLDVVYILTAFGCNMQGEIPLEVVVENVEFIHALCAERNLKIPTIYLADTMGWANPVEVKKRVGLVQKMAPDSRIGMHIHDTRGMGAANFFAALEMGVDLFDSSIAGLGGCPFGCFADMTAAGNICTEDMVLMCHELGIETGIDLTKLIEAARMAETIIGRSLMGRVMHTGTLDVIRDKRKAV